MNVLHLTLSFAPGGRRQAILSLAAGLRRLGVRCDLGCVVERGCEAAEAEPHFSEVFLARRKGLLDREAVARTVLHCRRRQIDVIHAHDAAAQALGAWVRLRRPKTKLLMTFHRTLSFESARWRDRLRNALCTRACGAIVTGSRERREHFLDRNWVSPKKVVRIPFGVDLARFAGDEAVRADVRGELGLSPDTFVLGVVGHFGPEKGIDVVVAGFNELLCQLRSSGGDPDVALIVCGRGTDDQERAVRQLAAAGDANKVHFLGFRRDLPRWFQAFDVFVHAPRQEAFGLVLIEAMAAGLPTIAASVGGVPDIVRHEQTGLLVPPEAPAELAAAAARLLFDRPLRQSLALAGLRVALQEYDLDGFARRHLRLYEDLLSGRPPRGADEHSEVEDGASLSAQHA